MKLIRLIRKDITRTDHRLPGYERAVLDAAKFFDDTQIIMDESVYLKIAATRGARRHLLRLGDMVESALTSFGITKERVQSWTRTKDCGCKARKQWLNRWGFKQQEKLAKIVSKAARWYGIS